jgi:hypothetical protein
MKIDDYKRLFEIKYEGSWLDDNARYAKCRICGTPIFDKYLIKNWNVLDTDKIKKRFYAAIRHHINTYHHELILPKLPKKIKMSEHTASNKDQDIALNKALHFLKNFPFRPYIKEEMPLKVWKPGIIVLPSEKEKKAHQK